MIKKILLNSIHAHKPVNTIRLYHNKLADEITKNSRKLLKKVKENV